MAMVVAVERDYCLFVAKGKSERTHLRSSDILFLHNLLSFFSVTLTSISFCCDKQNYTCIRSVSYTHLDVYKRQVSQAHVEITCTTTFSRIPLDRSRYT